MGTTEVPMPPMGGQVRIHRAFSAILERLGRISTTFSITGAKVAPGLSFLRYDRATGSIQGRRLDQSVARILTEDCACRRRECHYVHRLQDFPSTSMLSEVLRSDVDTLVIRRSSPARPWFMFGMERPSGTEAFTLEEIAAAEALAPILCLTAELAYTYESVACEKAILQAFPHQDGLRMIVGSGGEVLWAGRHDDAVNWERDVHPILSDVVRIADKVARATSQIVSVFELEHKRVAAINTSLPELLLEDCVAVCVGSTMTSVVGPELSVRERQVASLLADGYANVNIAALLRISENTVRTYVRRVYRKLGVVNRLDLAKALSTIPPRFAGQEGYADAGAVARRIGG